MKRCPKCDQNYLDDTLNFCLTDGTQLVADNVEATVVMERPTVTAAVRRKRRTGLWIGAVMLLLLIVGGAVGALALYFYGVKDRNVTAERTNAANTSKPAQSKRSATPAPTKAAAESDTPRVAETDEIDEDVTPIGWDATAAAFRGEAGKTYVFECPAGGALQAIWGNDIYTDFSSICTAAVHAGVIRLEDGGEVTIEYRPGRPTYGSTVKNGVKSNISGDHSRSFVVR